jgi:hypothetical protein
LPTNYSLLDIQHFDVSRSVITLLFLCFPHSQIMIVVIVRYTMMRQETGDALLILFVHLRPEQNWPSAHQRHSNRPLFPQPFLRRRIILSWFTMYWFLCVRSASVGVSKNLALGGASRNGSWTPGFSSSNSCFSSTPFLMRHCKHGLLENRFGPRRPLLVLLWSVA